MIAKPKDIFKKVSYRVLCAVTVFAMVCTILPMTALAGDSDRFSGGNGSESSPWLISTVEDLKNLSLFLNSGEAKGFDAKNAGIGNCYGYYFEQTTDIDLSKVQNWEPIGYSGNNYFAGNYDGNNYAISNIKCTGKVDADGFATGGLFGWVAFGSVSNLHVKNGVVSATGTNNYSYVGGIAGVVYGSTITNCSVTDSSIESKRTPSNNNCAGGVSGYSTGGVFKNCAATNNAVKAMAYCGGFVGEVDDDNNAGKSSFTNCFVADSSATAYSPNAQDTNAVGGFVGQVTASVLTLTNCFVYNTEIQIDANSAATPKFSGVFAGELWHDSYASIADINCYYESSSLSNNLGNALKKTSNEFKNGTVASLLGDSYVNADPYPSLASSPANYSAVDKAIAEAKALNKNKYADFSAVETAISAVVRGKLSAEQSVVDGYAAAIQKSLGELVRINQAVSTNRIYDGTATVVVSEVFFKDVYDTDEVSADAVGTLASPNAGTYTVVDLSNIVLKGEDAEWYEAPEKMSNLVTDVTISKVNPEITLNTQPGSYVQGGREIEVTATINNHLEYFDGLPTANQIVLTADNAKLKPGTSIVKNENTYTAVFVADDKINNLINFSANVSNDAVNYSALSSSVTKSVSIVGPADYSALNTVLNKIPDDLNLYTGETLQVLNDAVDSIQWNLLLPEQTIVDGYATAIEDAIQALEYKSADYAKVEEALAKIPSDLSIYTDESVKALNDVKSAVALGKNITEQATVDGYATAIENAVNGLKKKTETINPGSDVKDEIQDDSGKTTPSNNQQKPDKNIPSTGDNTSIFFYSIIAFLSALTVLVITKKRKKTIK